MVKQRKEVMIQNYSRRNIIQQFSEYEIVTTIVRCCFRDSRSVCFHGCGRSRYGDVSGSESESWTFKQTGCFLFKGAINFIISFWFSASILVKSDMISFLRDAFISSRFSGSTLGTLLGPAIRFSDGVFLAIEASKSPETSSATALLFQLE